MSAKVTFDYSKTSAFISEAEVDYMKKLTLDAKDLLVSKQPANVLDNEMLSLSQCFMAVASYIRKTSGDKHDAESMNRAVEKMVAEALKCNSVVNILETDV